MYLYEAIYTSVTLRLHALLLIDRLIIISLLQGEIYSGNHY